MPDTKVSDETAATALTGAELARIVQSGSSKKTTAAVLGHQFRGAKVRMTIDDTAQNPVAAVTITFDAAVFDTDSFWSAGAAQRLTIPAGLGITHVNVTAQIRVTSSTASTWRSVQINHLSSADADKGGYGNIGLDGGAATHTMVISTGPVAVADGDYFTLILSEESDTSVTIEGDQSFQTFMALHVIGMEPV